MVAHTKLRDDESLASLSPRTEVLSLTTDTESRNAEISWAATISPYSVVSVLLGLVLLAAALLKGHQLLTDFSPGVSIYTSRWFQTLTVMLEFGLALWLLSGLHKVRARGVAIIYFIGLAAVSGYMVTAGAECCGCLGRLAISPWFTFGFNLFAVCCLSICPPPIRAWDSFESRPYRATFALTAFVFVSVYLVAGTPEARLASMGVPESIADAELVVLDVENWTGKRLPVIDHIDIGQQIGTGRWRILLYHHNCPKCSALMEKLEREATATGPSIAFIQVPPPGGFMLPTVPVRQSRLVGGSLARTKRWAVVTPIILQLNDGIVVAVETDP